MHASIPMTLVSGFLGSGKTTLLRRWRQHPSLRHAAWIIHDLSETGLDAELLADDEGKPPMGMLVNRTAALHGPHARELLHSSLQQVLHEIALLRPTPPMVLVESTGAARPWPLLTALTQDPRFFLRHVVTTVDGLNLHRDFADGNLLESQTEPTTDPALRHASLVLAEQLAFASVVILTKTDTLASDRVHKQVATLQRIVPHAAIGLSAHGGLDWSDLESVRAPDPAALRRRAGQLGLIRDDCRAATADDIDCVILREKRPFHPERLYEACHQQLGTGLYRTKGYLWLASRPGQVLLWQQSGSQISLELTGQWRAEILRDPAGRLLPEERAHLQQQLDALDPVFGDRHIELSLIGLPAARNAFAAALRAALCTDAEVQAWQRGDEFPDPWPKQFRRFQ